MRLFWGARQAEIETETRRTMDALDKTVNGPDLIEVENKDWHVALQCSSCNIWMTSDPAKAGRFICSKCQGVAQVHGEVYPKKKVAKS